MTQNHMVLTSKGWVYFHHLHFDHFQITGLDQLKKLLTQLVRYVPGTSREGIRKVITSGTFKGLSEDTYGTNKKLMIWWKKCLLNAIVFVLHIYYCFWLEKQISKSSKWGRPRDIYRAQLREVLGTNDWTFWGGPRDIGHICFLNSTEKHIKLTLTGYSSELW